VKTFYDAPEMGSRLAIVYYRRKSVGWHPVTHMVSLLAELMKAELLSVDRPASASLLQKVISLRPTRGRQACIVITPTPTDLQVFALAMGRRPRFGRRVAWIIDSFWHERIPWFVRYGCPFDEIFVTREEDVAVWAERTKRPVRCLPWGSDVLRLGSSQLQRPVDVLRVGRQPHGWDDDERTKLACARVGLEFRGSPPTHQNALENQRNLQRAYASSKVLVAFSNTAHKSRYTHETRDYITARWTDALANGTAIAGVPPRSHCVDSLLWPEGLIALDTLDLQEGVERIANAVRTWSPAQAELNYRKALQRLDWRWRFRELSEAVRVPSERLDREILEIERLIQGGSGDNLQTSFADDSVRDGARSSSAMDGTH